MLLMLLLPYFKFQLEVNINLELCEAGSAAGKYFPLYPALPEAHVSLKRTML